MREGFFRFTILLPLCALAACSGMPVHEVLPDGARDRIGSTEVVAPVRQSEIYVFVPVATAGASQGLIGALVDVTIDSIRTSKAENAVKPLRNALVDFNFDDALQSDLKASLAQSKWLKVQNVRVQKDISNNAMDLSLTDSKADAVLFATTDYKLSNDGDVLAITTVASLFPNSDALRTFKQGTAANPKTNLKNSLYYNSFAFVTKLPGATSDRDHNITLWSAQNGAATRDALKVGAAKLGEMLAKDLENNGQSGAPAGATDAVLNVSTINEINVGIKGQILAQDTSGTMMRSSDGTYVFAAPSAVQP